MKQIKTWGIARLHMEECYGFLDFARDSTDLLPKEQEEEDGPQVQGLVRALAAGATPVLTAIIEKFSSAMSEWDEVLKLSTKNPITVQITAADELRDKSWRQMNAYTKAMTGHPDADVAATAEEYTEIFDKYGDPTNLAQTEEGGVILNLLGDIAALGTEKLEKIDGQPWYDRLKKAQDDFRDLEKQRSDAETKQDPGITRTKRKAAEAAYRELVKTVNSLAYINGDEPYAAFIDRMNAYTERQSDISKARETRNAKNNTPTEPDDKPTGEEGSEPDDRPVVE